MSLFIIYKLYFNLINNKYYYYYNNIIIDVTYIIYILSLLPFSKNIINLIFTHNIYLVSESKIINYNNEQLNNVKLFSIIKKIEYLDKYLKINLTNIKNKIYTIDNKIPINFLLLYFNKIIINNNSKLIIKYFNDNKIVILNKNLLFKDIF